MEHVSAYQCTSASCAWGGFVCVASTVSHIACVTLAYIRARTAARRGSWDVLGVYPESSATSGNGGGTLWGGFSTTRLRGGSSSTSSAGGGTYRDEDVATAVTRHNAGIRQQQGAPAKRPADKLIPVAK